jgi:hypothetical protein
MALVKGEQVPDHSPMEFKEFSPSVAGESTKVHSSSSSCKEPDVELAFIEDGLPPVDRGIRAWLFLLACAMLEALVWGVSIVFGCIELRFETDEEIGYADAFGVFQDYYSEHEPFKESGNIAVIGTCAMV